MNAAVDALLHRRAAELSPASVAAVAVVASACFGAAVGGYVGRLQILYAAVKMPFFFLGTLSVSFAAMHLFAARDLRARETFGAALETIALTAIVLGALAPIVWLVSVSCPPHSARAYSFNVLLLTGCVAAAGVAGVGRLHQRLRSVRLTIAWVVIYQFTGAQMAWLLKPWVSHTFTDDRFLPLRENLQGNFYESVFWTMIRLFS